MKIFVAIISTILLVQFAIAGPVRSKRADAYVDFMEVTAKILKQLVPISEKSVKNALEKMPKTEDYVEYRKTLESYLEDIHAKKDKADVCFIKSIRLIKKFTAFADEYSKDDAPKEAKEVYKLLDTDEDDSLKADIDQWKTRFADFVIEYGSKDENDEDDISEEDAQKFMTLVTEVC